MHVNWAADLDQRVCAQLQTMTGTLAALSLVYMLSLRQSSVPPDDCTHLEVAVARNGLVEKEEVLGVILVHRSDPVGASSV